MDAESRKSFRHGFILKEADLRRIVDLTVDQFTKLSLHNTVSSFKMKFKNGVIAEKSSLEDVLSQENIGSNQIIRLFYELKGDEPKDPTFLHIEFVNADLDDEPGYVSARFKVFGHSRDWVFVTSSLLEERIEKVKRFAPNQLGDRGSSKLFLRLLSPILLLVVFLGFFFAMQQKLSKLPEPGKKLEEEWKAGKLKDPIEALVFLENHRGRPSLTDIFPLKPLLYFVILVIGLTGVLFFFARYYPVYNFLWGEYVDEFRRKESIRRFWTIIIVVGIIVSFIGGILANSFNLWKPSF